MYWIAVEQLKPLRLTIRVEGDGLKDALLLAGQAGGMSTAKAVFRDGVVDVTMQPIPTKWELSWSLTIIADGDDGTYRGRLTVEDEDNILLREPIEVNVVDGKAMWIETINIDIREAASATPHEIALNPTSPNVRNVPTDPTWGIDELAFDPRKITAGDPSAIPDHLKERPPAATIQQVWFGTTRTRDQTASGIAFADRYSEAVTYGWCDVQIPQWHKTGSLGSSWYKRWRSGHDDRLRIVDIDTLGAESFWSDVAKAVASAPVGERHAVVWIHGYKNSFEDAALRAAQLGADLKITGAMGFFAWASRDSVGKYMGDESAIESSEHQIEQFLIDFAMKSGADAVHVIAHSMGNRAVLRIVERMVLRAQAGTGVRFGQIILAAPDVNEHLFSKVASAYEGVSKRTTIYVSSRDLALKLSALLHGTSRAGGSNNAVLTVDSLDTVVASYVETGVVGHDYFATSLEFINDMYDLIHRDSPPTKRIGLQPVEEEPYRYWVMRPSI